METNQEKNAWKEVRYHKKFLNALRGVYVFIMASPHILVAAIFSGLVIILGFYFKIGEAEWLALVFAIGLVFIAEAFNTAIEIDIDLTSPDYHPYARDTKDVAAGAVLLSLLLATIVGAMIFLPKIF